MEYLSSGTTQWVGLCLAAMLILVRHMSGYCCGVGDRQEERTPHDNEPDSSEPLAIASGVPAVNPHHQQVEINRKERTIQFVSGFFFGFYLKCFLRNSFPNKTTQTTEFFPNKATFCEILIWHVPGLLFMVVFMVFTVLGLVCSCLLSPNRGRETAETSRHDDASSCLDDDDNVLPS